jgi:hypothetical protein
MKSRGLLAEFLVATLAIVAPTAKAQSDGPKDQNGPDQLVVGDWYDVTIQRHDVKEQAFGMLVKVTDDWVVLGMVMEACNDVKSGVPYLRDVPVIGVMFGKSTRLAVMSKAYVWIPRDAVHVDKRQSVPNKIKAEFENDAPVLAGDCDGYLVEKNGERANDGGDCLGVSDGQVVFERRTMDSVRVPDPRWDHVPIIGDLRATQRLVERKVEKRVPLADVLYLATQVQLTPEQVKFVNSQ